MRTTSTEIPDVLILQPKVFSDTRGYFVEVYNKRRFKDATGIDVEFVQDNVSRSLKNVIRGLHYQITRAQDKLVRVTHGEIWDVAIDIRRSSPNFGKWVAFRLSSESMRMAWIPRGFAHGFLVMSEVADVHYKTTDYYAPESERTIRWDDPTLRIPWPTSGPPILTDKDRTGSDFANADTFA